MVLNQTANRRAVRWDNVLQRSRDHRLALGLGQEAHRQVTVHLVAVEVGVVRVAVGVMHADGLLGRRQVPQHADAVGHHRGLVQGWLAVHDDQIPVHEVAANRDTLPDSEPAGQCSPFDRVEPLELHHFAKAVANEVGARVSGLACAALDKRAEMRDVVSGDGLRPAQVDREAKGQADLASEDVEVGRDDRAAGVVDALAHHVHPEEALFALQQLTNTVGRRVSVGARGSFCRVHESIDMALQFEPRRDQFSEVPRGGLGLSLGAGGSELRYLGLVLHLHVLDLGGHREDLGMRSE